VTLKGAGAAGIFDDSYKTFHRDVFELIGEGKLVGIKKRGWETGNTTIVMLPQAAPTSRERTAPADAPRRGRYPKNCTLTRQVSTGA